MYKLFKHKENKGFTLIELMIVIAIIGILAAIAIPNFARYIVRTKKAEAPMMISGIKINEIDFFNNETLVDDSDDTNIIESASYLVGGNVPDVAKVSSGKISSDWSQEPFATLGFEGPTTTYCSYNIIGNADGTAAEPANSIQIFALCDLEANGTAGVHHTELVDPFTKTEIEVAGMATYGVMLADGSTGGAVLQNDDDKTEQ